MHLGRVLFPIAVTCILLVSLFCLQRETETECGQGKGQPLSFLHVTRAALACGLMLFGVLICLHTSCVRTCTVIDEYITLHYKTIILWVIHLFLLNGSVTWLYLFFLQSGIQLPSFHILITCSCCVYSVTPPGLHLISANPHKQVGPDGEMVTWEWGS